MLDRRRGYPTTVQAIKLLLLTACRPSSRFAGWDEFNLNVVIWSMPLRPDEEAPSACGFPLPHQAMESPRRQHVYPGRDTLRLPVCENIFNGAMRRMGYHEHQTARGSRRRISTTLGERGDNCD